MSTTIRLYELTGADEHVQFSPYCWRSRYALAHKGLSVETQPWRFSDKEAIAFSSQGKVPVLVDGEQTVNDSWAIAEYLERTYPDRPSLFGADTARALTRFINNWTDGVVHPPLARLLLPDIHDILASGDRDYFQSTREAMLGATFETLRTEREQWLKAFRTALAPLRRTLEVQPYLAGETPAYADYILAGTFQWARVCSAQNLLESDDPVAAWRERMLDAHGGFARKASLAY